MTSDNVLDKIDDIVRLVHDIGENLDEKYYEQTYQDMEYLLNQDMLNNVDIKQKKLELHNK